MGSISISQLQGPQFDHEFYVFSWCLHKKFLQILIFPPLGVRVNECVNAWIDDALQWTGIRVVLPRAQCSTITLTRNKR